MDPKREFHRFVEGLLAPEPYDRLEFAMKAWLHGYLAALRDTDIPASRYWATRSDLAQLITKELSSHPFQIFRRPTHLPDVLREADDDKFDERKEDENDPRR